MDVLEVIVVVIAAVLAGSVLGPRWRIPPPLVLLVLGAAAGLVPMLRHVDVPPDLVLVVFLPGLLYWESLTTSLREIRANLRIIVMMSVLLVVATAAAVAAVLHALGMAWGPAWVLGAVLAPTDATAVGRLARGMPRRLITTLRAESLVNDGTALVIYAIAIRAMSESISGGYVVGRFFLSYLGGLLAGVLTWRLAVLARERLREPIQQSVISVLTPFAAFLLAETVHASGVLAVVVAGLLISQSGPRVIPAAARVQAQSFWSVLTYLFNGGLFVLVGMQMYSTVDELSSTTVARGLVWTGTAFVAVLGARLAWFHTTPYLIRLIDRRPVQRTRRLSWRHRMPSAWAGFRGGVSLALALGVPANLPDGTAFPGRDLIVFVTCGVILLTLMLHGLTLPSVIRWARLPADDALADERHHAEKVATQAAIDALPVEAERLGADPDVVAKLEAEYRSHAETLNQVEAEGGIRRNSPESEFDALRLALLTHKRAAVVELRNAQDIDDTVLREVQAHLDAEEVRLSRGQALAYE